MLVNRFGDNSVHDQPEIFGDKSEAAGPASLTSYRLADMFCAYGAGNLGLPGG